MNGSMPDKCNLAGWIVVLAAACCAGCQAQRENATSRPSRIITWADPDDPEATTEIVRDWNNNDSDFVTIGANGQVQFADGSVCRTCDTDVENAQIQLGGGQLIDIRFGVHPDGDGVRRVYLVDQADGTFIDLGGGRDSAVTFTPTAEPFGDPDDDGDDRAVPASERSNPLNKSQSQQAPLCGALGWVISGSLGLMTLLMWRRR